MSTEVDQEYDTVRMAYNEAVQEAGIILDKVERSLAEAVGHAVLLTVDSSKSAQEVPTQIVTAAQMARDLSILIDELVEAGE